MKRDNAPQQELTLLLEGRVELLGRILRSSNETFLVRVSGGDGSARAVYKPEAGERPLSDFEPGLYRQSLPLAPGVGGAGETQQAPFGGPCLQGRDALSGFGP